MYESWWDELDPIVDLSPLSPVSLLSSPLPLTSEQRSLVIRTICRRLQHEHYYNDINQLNDADLLEFGYLSGLRDVIGQIVTQTTLSSFANSKPSFNANTTNSTTSQPVEPQYHPKMQLPLGEDGRRDLSDLITSHPDFASFTKNIHLPPVNRWTMDLLLYLCYKFGFWREALFAARCHQMRKSMIKQRLQNKRRQPRVKSAVVHF